MIVPAPNRPPGVLEVRLHAPSPDAVVVRAEGPLQLRTAALLAERVRQQLRRAPHVVLDLSSVTTLDPRVAADVRAMDAAACAEGARLHLAAENDSVVAGLRRICPGRRVVPGPADAVLAALGADAP